MMRGTGAFPACAADVSGLVFSALALRHFLRLKVLGYLDTLCSVSQSI